MSTRDAKDLLRRYEAGDVTDAEKALVESWYLNYSQNAPIPDIDDELLNQNQQESIYHLLKESRRKTFPRRGRYLMAAAAVLAIPFAIILFIKINRGPKQRLIANSTQKHDLLPGKNKAVLILSNGTSIQLTDAKTGKLASEKGTTISKAANGQIVYGTHPSAAAMAVTAFNTLIVPRGGQYQLVLPDGTKIWLNSASTLKYPVTFTGKTREIELSGEAYFEVAHNPHKPFRVISNGQVVEVLGTHFNVNAYPDEPASKTTLLEGSVKVSSNGLTNTIVPNQQVAIKNGVMNIAKADVARATAWKNGLFYFEEDDLKTVMRQLARWYDVDIKYEGQLPAREFSGQISKNIEASKLLKILTFEKINYRIEGRTIIITP